MYCLNSVQAFKLAQRGAFQMCFGAFAPCVHSLATTLDQLSACLGNLTYSDRLGNPSASLLFPCELFLPPKGFFIIVTLEQFGFQSSNYTTFLIFLSNNNNNNI